MSPEYHALTATRKRWPAEIHPLFDVTDVLDADLRSCHIDAARGRRARALVASGWTETEASEREVDLIKALTAVPP